MNTSSFNLEDSLRSLKEGCLGFSKRPRRNRSSEAIRDLIAETHLLPQHLITPYFLKEGESGKEAISSMPGIFRHTLHDLLHAIEYQLSLGIKAAILFFYIDDSKKNWHGSEAYKKDGLFYTSIEIIKSYFPELLLIVDIALDPFTDHGFDGLIDSNFHVMNDPSVVALGHMALTAAEAGADLIAPSDMMDGRIEYLRDLLDKKSFSNVGILSYCVKYVSALYGPFREALGSSPKNGDKKNFQLSPRNSREAILECLLDDEEAADLLMIKPAITSLDIISNLRKRSLKPIGAFQVSGEYAMIQAAHQKGWIDGDKMLIESLIAMRRAGADFILSYGAPHAAALLQKGFYL
ncbi:MAG: porphobilinogen synthase [Chlamydia sp.]